MIQPLSWEISVAIDALHGRYCEALDGHDMPAWLATFVNEPSASYVCTTAESVEAKRRIALIHDDCYARLQDRVTFVTRIWAGTYQEYRARHVVRQTSCLKASDNEFAGRANFIIALTTSDSQLTETTIAGVYEDRIRIVDGQALFVSRKAIIDGALLPRYITYPL